MNIIRGKASIFKEKVCKIFGNSSVYPMAKAEIFLGLLEEHPEDVCEILRIALRHGHMEPSDNASPFLSKYAGRDIFGALGENDNKIEKVNGKVLLAWARREALTSDVVEHYAYIVNSDIRRVKKIAYLLSIFHESFVEYVFRRAFSGVASFPISYNHCDFACFAQNSEEFS